MEQVKTNCNCAFVIEYRGYEDDLEWDANEYLIQNHQSRYAESAFLENTDIDDDSGRVTMRRVFALQDLPAAISFLNAIQNGFCCDKLYGDEVVEFITKVQSGLFDFIASGGYDQALSDYNGLDKKPYFHYESDPVYKVDFKVYLVNNCPNTQVL